MRTGVGSSRGRAARAAAPEAAPATAWRAPAAAVAALAAFALASCSEKITTVDPSFTAPEGAASTQSGLTVWRELPTHIYTYKRNPAPPDNLIGVQEFGVSIPGQLHGVIRDSTASNAYQVFRREPNGGFRSLYAYAAVPARKWFDRGWEIYHFTDADSTVPTHTYIGRGVVGAAATLTSPLTNEASDQVRAVDAITYTGPTGHDSHGGPAPLDSLFLMEWRAVPNAVGYYIHVYQWAFNLIQVDEQVESGMPAPLFIGKSHDLLVAYLPVPNPQPDPVRFQMPSPDARPPEARIMTVRLTHYGQEYLVRIAAVDASGQLIAYTYGTNGQEIATLPDGTTLPSGQYAVYPLGAVAVSPRRPTPIARALLESP
jgi:hypothetical protein